MVVNSRYNPYSYEELVKPLVDYTTAYKEQEAVADTLASQATTLDSLSPDLDSAEYQNYNNWKEELRAASDQLATSGLSPEVRSRISSLSTRYGTELSPALEKIKTRSQLVKEQRDLQAKNPNLIFDVDYSNAPLSSINPASTYTAYNLDNILKEVGNDVYSRMSAGEGVPSVDEYLTKYATGLSDANKIALINNAVTSGMNLGSSTYQQKEFDNYINKIKATKTGSRGSTGTPSPTGKLTTINAYDGTAINVSYNKKTGKYQIKNKSGKDVVLPDNYSGDDILKGYYGGDYGYISGPDGNTLPRVRSTETLPDGKSRETYQVLIDGKWTSLPKGKQTTQEELYNLTHKKDSFPRLSDADTRYRVSPAVKEDLESKVAKKKWKKEPLHNYHDLEDPVTMKGSVLPSNTVRKLEKLEEAGIPFDVTIYRDSNDQVIAWDIDIDSDAAARFYNRPIEDSFGA